MTQLCFLAAALMAPAALNQTPPKPFESGKAKLWICADTDDNWNPVGATGDPDKKEKDKPAVFTWPAGKPFNFLLKNPKGVGFGGYLGLVVHRQKPDLTDGDHVEERLIETDDKSTMYASTNGVIKLEAGTYNVWIIPWDARDVNFKSGNFKRYLARVTLQVKPASALR